MSQPFRTPLPHAHVGTHSTWGSSAALASELKSSTLAEYWRDASTTRCTCTTTATSQRSFSGCFGTPQKNHFHPVTSHRSGPHSSLNTEVSVGALSTRTVMTIKSWWLRANHIVSLRNAGILYVASELLSSFIPQLSQQITLKAGTPKFACIESVRLSHSSVWRGSA